MPSLTREDSANQLSAKINAIEKYFERNIGPEITNYIFGGTNVSRYLKKISHYPVFFSNIFSLAFVFARGCLRCDNDSEISINQKASKQSSLRIINSLGKAYSQYPVTSELIQFVLSDIQFEMIQGSQCELYEIFENLSTFSSLEFSLSKYYKVIAQWKAAPSRFTMDSVELVLMFYKLLQVMTFLKEYDLKQEGNTFSFVNKQAMDFGDFDAKYSIVPVGHLIYFDASKYFDMYSLFSVDKTEENGTKRLDLRYVAGDGIKSLTFTVMDTLPDGVENDGTYIVDDAGDYYYDIIGEDWDYREEEQDSKKKYNSIEHVHAINYKYIKNLALAISDVIGANLGSKEILYKEYYPRHRDVFKSVKEQMDKTSDIESIKMDWDSVIVMLLIDSSPTSVLETLFKEMPQTFIDIAKNLCKRIDNSEMVIHNKTDDELRQLVYDLIETKLVIGETSGFGKIPRKKSDKRLFARVAARLIISSLSEAHEEETVEKTICAGNIYDNISLLKRMKNDVSAEQRCKYVCIILAETFRHLVCFYRGLLAYGEVKAEFDAESSNRFFSETQIAAYQKKLHNAFISAAKKEANAIQKLRSSEYCDMIELLNRFVKMAEECRINSSTGRNLYNALGKHEFLNAGEFKAYTNLFISNYNGIDENNVDEWISFSLEILRYLRRDTFKEVYSTPFNAIYPFTAIYNCGNENYDGYKTVTFTLNIDVNGDDLVDNKEYINILSEFSYDQSYVFYCLPNVLRSTEKWWIDPVLVNFKEFNDIFVDEELNL